MPSPNNPTPRIILAAWGLLAALMLWIPHTATAAQYPPPAEGWGAAIWHTAESVYGGPPPLCGTLTVEYDRAPVFHPGRGGEASIPAKPGTECFAHLAPMRPGAGEYLCNVTLHEYGHLMGLGHVPDPHALMYGDPWAEAAPWEYVGHPACWKFGHWQRWQSYLASERAAGD